MNFQQVLMAAATQGGGAQVAAGFASWPSLIGAEMMVNGDCSSGTGWTLGTGVAIAAGKMTAATTGGVGNINSGVGAAAFIEGATYRCAETADSFAAGSMAVLLGSELGPSHSTAAAFSDDIVAAGLEDGGWNMILTSSTAQLDNFSVKSVGLLGVEADWAFTGDATWRAEGYNCITFDDLGGNTAELTGSAKASFDSGVSVSTICTVTLTGGNETVGPLSGTLQVSLKGGPAVDFVFNDTASQQVTHNVTSGTDLGFEITTSGITAGNLMRVQIDLAA